MTTKYVGAGLDMGGTKIANAGTPSSASDLATKGYVDNIAAGLDPKQSARVASTANISVTAPGTAIDSITMAASDRVLLKNQTTASENGIYTWTGSASAMTRTADGSQGTLTPGSNIFIEEGTANHDTAWLLTTDGVITVGTTAQVWSAYGTGSSYTAGNGLSLTVNTFAVVPGSGILADGASTRIDPTYAGLAKRASGTVAAGSATVVIAHGMGVVPYAIQVLDASGNLVEPDIQLTSTNLTLVFNTAPTASQYTWQAIA